jgi:Zn-dependent protease with chaperone function
MKRQITVPEALGMIIGPLAGTIILLLSEELFYILIGGLDELLFLFLFFVLVVAVPAFVSVFVAAMLQSWRYKTVNGTLAIFILVGTLAFDIVRMSTEFWGFVWAMVRLAIALSMSLLALNLWRNLKHKAAANKSADKAVENIPLKAIPRTSVFLRVLALISVPFVLVTLVSASLITLGFSALFLMILLQLPRIPIVILAAAGIAPLAALWATVTAIGAIVRPKPWSHPAIIIRSEAYPELREIIDEVAGKMGTRSPDHLILHFEPVFFVAQARMKLMDGEVSGRILAMGMPLLKELSLPELKAVLAHEFAHYSGNDTLYSLVVSPVYRGIGSSIQTIRAGSEGGGTFSGITALLQLPSIYFLINFLEYFSSIDNMLGRSRELRADWLAASQYGKENLIMSLEKASISSALFVKLLDSIKLKEKSSLFEEYASELEKNEDDKRDVYAQISEYSETAFDTHPSLRTRKESLPEFPVAILRDTRGIAGMVSDEEKRLSEMIVERFQISMKTKEGEMESAEDET